MKRKGLLIWMGISALLLSLLGCDQRTQLYAGDVHGQRLTVFETRQRGPLRFEVWPVLRWGDLPALPLRFEATSRGAPYSLDLYGDVPVVVIDDPVGYYTESLAHEDLAPVMAYLDPATFSRQDFERYAVFFRDVWPQVAGQVTLRNGGRSFHVIGLVHGKSDADFVRSYRRDGDPAGQQIEVWTNGEIHFKVSSGGLESTNLSRKVQLPGQVIALSADGRFTLEVLRSYRSLAGTTLMDDFELVAED